MQRTDLPVEVSVTLDASGNYQSPWVDSGEVHSVRFVYSFSGTPAPTVEIEQSMDGTTVTASGASSSSDGQQFIAARYFRISAYGGGANAAFRASVRVAS